MVIFATAAVKANDSIIKIDDLLKQDNLDFNQIDVEWNIVKGALEKAFAVKPEDIQIVADPFIQLKLDDLQASRTDLMIRIDNNVALGKVGKLKNKSDLQTQIHDMAALLNGINTLAAIEFRFLKSDIDNLVQWAGTTGALSTPKPDAELMKIADASIKSRQGIVTSKLIA
jgi:hypothetical protein